MKRIFLLLLALPILAVDTSAQGLGGCARGTQQGYVTVTAATTLVYARGREQAATVQPGDELRVCRFAGSDAVVTIWSHGVGYLLPRSAAGELRSEPTVREVTPQDLACVGREMDEVQRNYRGDQQDWQMLELARRRGISLEMLAAIRSAGTRAMLQNQEIPACTSN